MAPMSPAATPISLSPSRRAWLRFKRNRLGYWSLLIFCALVLVSLAREPEVAALEARCIADNVRHVELFFDPQTHTVRGIDLATVFAGIARALRAAQAEDGFSSRMILCFLRHLSEADAFSTLEAALPLRAEYADLWHGIGLDSGEVGNPPAKFAGVFARARELGFRVVAHAGEEGPPAYVQEALDVLKADLRALTADVQVEQEEHDEVVVIKPLFLVSDYQ